MIHKAWCCIEEVPYYFSRSYIKFQGHTGWKIDDLDQIWARLLGRSQLSNPSDLPCYTDIFHRRGLYTFYMWKHTACIVAECAKIITVYQINQPMLLKNAIQLYQVSKHTACMYSWRTNANSVLIPWPSESLQPPIDHHKAGFVVFGKVCSGFSLIRRLTTA